MDYAMQDFKFLRLCLRYYCRCVPCIIKQYFTGSQFGFPYQLFKIFLLFTKIVIHYRYCLRINHQACFSPPLPCFSFRRFFLFFFFFLYIFFFLYFFKKKEKKKKKKNKKNSSVGKKKKKKFSPGRS